jgi:hypothetical protein
MTGMEFLLLIHGSEDAWEQASEDERKQTYAQYEAFGQALAQAGVKVTGGAELAPSRSASIVRGTGDDAIVTDGPFTEAREQFAGYYAIDVPTQADAVEWAKRLPSAVVEVRASVQP